MASKTIATSNLLTPARRWFQLSCKERSRVYTRRTHSEQKNSVRANAPFPSRHPLHLVNQCQMQQLSRRRLIYADQRRKLYDQRDAYHTEMQDRMDKASSYEAVLLTFELNDGMAEFAKQIGRYNFGSTDLIGASEMPSSEVIATSSQSEQNNSAELESDLIELVVQIEPQTADTPWTLGTSIRTTPILPGAPFASLPH